MILTYFAPVPPVYYADQACERAKLHLRENAEGVQYVGQVHDDLKYTMVCTSSIEHVDISLLTDHL